MTLLRIMVPDDIPDEEDDAMDQSVANMIELVARGTIEKHMGPDNHPSGSPQSAHGGGPNAKKDKLKYYIAIHGFGPKRDASFGTNYYGGFATREAAEARLKQLLESKSAISSGRFKAEVVRRKARDTWDIDRPEELDDVEKHYGPGAHESGSEQSAHAGGEGHKRDLVGLLYANVPKWISDSGPLPHVDVISFTRDQIMDLVIGPEPSWGYGQVVYGAHRRIARMTFDEYFAADRAGRILYSTYVTPKKPGETNHNGDRYVTFKDVYEGTPTLLIDRFVYERAYEGVNLLEKGAHPGIEQMKAIMTYAHEYAHAIVHGERPEKNVVVSQGLLSSIYEHDEGFTQIIAEDVVRSAFPKAEWDSIFRNHVYAEHHQSAYGLIQKSRRHKGEWLQAVRSNWKRAYVELLKFREGDVQPRLVTDTDLFGDGKKVKRWDWWDVRDGPVFAKSKLPPDWYEQHWIAHLKLRTLDVAKHLADHDEKTHGSWATGFGGKPILGANNTPHVYEPGTIPIPPGHVRMYHYTQEEGVVDKIATEGFTVDAARGATYGEPNAVWFSTRVPSSVKEFVEVAFPKEFLAGAVVGGWTESDFASVARQYPDQDPIASFQATVSDMAFPSNIPTSAILAIHKPSYSSYRYLQEYKAEVLAGEYDWVYDKQWEGSGERIAVERIKAENVTKHYGPGDHPSGSPQSIHRGGQPLDAPAQPTLPGIDAAPHPVTRLTFRMPSNKLGASGESIAYLEDKVTQFRMPSRDFTAKEQSIIKGAVEEFEQTFPGALPPALEFVMVKDIDGGTFAYVKYDEATRGKVFVSEEWDENFYRWSLRESGFVASEVALTEDSTLSGGFGRQVVIFHELAHVADHHNAIQNKTRQTGGVADLSYIPFYSQDWYGPDLVDHDDWRLPSTYSTRSHAEYFAEALTDHFVSKGKAAPLSTFTVHQFLRHNAGQWESAENWAAEVRKVVKADGLVMDVLNRDDYTWPNDA